VLGPDGLSRFEELSRRQAARTAILYAFDLIELDGEDLRHRPFPDRKAVLAQLLSNLKAGILLNEHIAEMGLPCSPVRASLVLRATIPIDPARAASDQGPQTRRVRRARDLE
jgi:hypothetical protein